ncbi:MAG: twin-arginine translocation pathway signal protein [Pseudomonadota bacterium]
MSRKPQDAQDPARRDFLKLSMTTAPLAAAAVATGATSAQADPAEAAMDRETLQDTAHTRAYYDSARF